MPPASQATGAVNVNLLAGNATGAAGSDTLALIENVIGSNFDDLIVASNGADNHFRVGPATIPSASNMRRLAVNVNLSTATQTATGGSGSDLFSRSNE